MSGLVSQLGHLKILSTRLRLLMGEPNTVAVHRCRFVDHVPSAIAALAFPPLPLPSVKGKAKYSSGKPAQKFGTLAVGRANGNIDLCEWSGAEKENQSTQAWVVRKASSRQVCIFLALYDFAFNSRHCPDHILLKSTLWPLLYVFRTA
jgi:hypothetical protein